MGACQRWTILGIAVPLLCRSRSLVVTNADLKEKEELKAQLQEQNSAHAQIEVRKVEGSIWHGKTAICMGCSCLTAYALDTSYC